MNDKSIIGWNMTKSCIQFVSRNQEEYVKAMFKYPSNLDADFDYENMNPLSGILILYYEQLDKDAEPLENTDFSHLFDDSKDTK